MKILTVGNNAILPDYMLDCITHGFKRLFGADCVDANRLWYLYQSEDLFNPDKFESIRMPLHGWGLTYGGNLTQEEEDSDRGDIPMKISKGYFDLIVIGICRDDPENEKCDYRWETILEAALKHQPKNRLVFVDGSDGHWFKREDLLNKGIFFKRELSDHRAHPISLAIPEEMIQSPKPKDQLYSAKNVPSHNRANYRCATNEEYYEDFTRSYFGVTCKKGGWDCMRHYEILAASCVPYFVDIEGVPDRTMTNFPKDLCKEAAKLISINFNVQRCSGLSVGSSEFDHDEYDNLQGKLFEYTKQHLITTKLAKYVLDVVSSKA